MPGYLIVAGITMILLGLILAALFYGHKQVALGSISFDPCCFTFWISCTIGSLIACYGFAWQVFQLIKKGVVR